MIESLRKFFRIRTDKEIIEEYLAASIDLVDLERRQKELLQRGYRC